MPFFVSRDKITGYEVRERNLYNENERLRKENSELQKKIQNQQATIQEQSNFIRERDKKIIKLEQKQSKFIDAGSVLQKAVEDFSVQIEGALARLPIEQADEVAQEAT